MHLYIETNAERVNNLFDPRLEQHILYKGDKWLICLSHDLLSYNFPAKENRDKYRGSFFLQETSEKLISIPNGDGA